MEDERYQAIGPLIAERHWNQGVVSLTFFTPVSGREFELQWNCPDSDLIEAATVEAFRSIEDEFFWDGARWVGWDVHDPVVVFHRLLHTPELEDFTHRLLLARGLHQVLSSDGVVTPEEEALFAQFCPEFPSMPTFEPLCEDDLLGLSVRAKDAFYAFCCAMALCDLDLESSERQLLEELAASLGLTSLREWELFQAARSYLIDRLLDADLASEAALAQATESGEALGLEAEEVVRIAQRRRLRRLHEATLPRGEEAAGLGEILDEWILR